jgi:hypothetical protein
MATDLYEKDYYAWANDTAAAIRSGAFNQIDIEALADEVADIARKEKRSLQSRLEVLISHLLKWDYQESKRTISWMGTISIQRSRVLKLLKDSPSLKPWLRDNLTEIYEDAVQLAVRDTSKRPNEFPPACPYTLDEILSTKDVNLPPSAARS